MGRVRTPKARREALLAEFARSGVSGQKFAALVGVNYQTFASWVQQWRRRRGESPSAAKGAKVWRLVEAVVETGGSAEGRWCWRRCCCGLLSRGRTGRAEFRGQPARVPGHRALVNGHLPWIVIRVTPQVIPMSDNSREAELRTLLQAREEENRRLRLEVTSFKAEAASFKAEVTLLKTENTLLRRKIDLLVRRIFGASSEPSGAR